MKNFTLFTLFCFAWLACFQVQAQNTACAGSGTDADEGSFIEGYTYSFTTSGTNVTAVFELKEAKEGLVAFAQTYNPNFAERPMTGEGGQKFSATFTNQAIGSTFKMRCKFAFAGGLATTKIFEYTVGEDCGVAILNLPITFENEGIDYELVDFGGNASELVADPTDASNRVVKSIKTASAEDWAGTSVGNENGLASAIPFMEGSTNLSVRVWSPTAGTPVRVKVENAADGNIAVETEAVTTVAEQWETLVFNFANHAADTPPINLSNSYDKISIFFNFGTSGADAGAQTYYWDDIQFVAGEVLELPVNFENEDINYDLADFGGITAEIVADPTDATNKVVKIVRSNTAVPTAGVTIGGETGFASSIPFAPGATTISVRVWSPDADVPIRFKVENSFDPTQSVETETRTTVAGEWETLLFNFSNEALGTAAINFSYDFNKATLFFNFGVEGESVGEKTYYFDDMVFEGQNDTSKLLLIPMDFESDEIEYAFDGFEGGVFTRIANPQSTGINTSGFVGQMVKNPGATYAGVVIPLGAPIDFSQGKTWKAKVLMPREGAKLLFKIENQQNPGISFEKEVIGTKAGEWEELTIDYTGVNTDNSYQKLVLIFDNGTAGDGSGNFTYLIDDILLTSAGNGGENGGGTTTPGQMNLPVTFDEEGVDYGLVGFGGTENVIVADPTNASNMVARVIKTAGAEGWAGTTVTDKEGDLELGFSSKVPFTTTNTKMNVRVWSPDAGIPVRLKIESHLNAGHSVETEATTTVAGDWQTLTFDFANQATGTAALNLTYNMNKASIFFNFGATGEAAGEKTYYFDDMKFGAATSDNGGGTDPEPTGPLPTVPLDFESGDLTYNFLDFEGAVLSRIANPQINEKNPSAFVAQLVKNAGQVYAGSVIPLASPIDFSTDKTFSVKVFMPRVGAKMLLKVENQNNPEISYEIEATGTLANEWEELMFNFTEIPTNVSYQKITIIFDNGTMGDGSANFTYLFDDIKLITDTSGDALPVLPVDFESEEVEYEFLNFEGGELSRIANPQSKGINTSSFVGQMVKNEGQVYAGSVIPMARPIDFSEGKIFKLKVYMPRVGAKLLFKVENQSNASLSFEKEVSGTVANEWEELTIDYSEIPTNVSYQKLVLIFDNGTMGDGSANFTYLIDDILLTDGEGTTTMQMDLPVTFDEENVNYGLAGFGGAEASTIVTDPTNPANKVAKVVKAEGSEVWAGTTITARVGGVETGFRNKVPFTATETLMSVRVWSPDAGIPVRLKIENHLNNEQSVETQAMTTKAGEWETLTFNFANHAEGTAALNPALNLNKASIFFNFGSTGAEKTYYFDDLMFGVTACTPPAKPVITLSGAGTETITMTSSSQSCNQWFLNGEII